MIRLITRAKSFRFAAIALLAIGLLIAGGRIHNIIKEASADNVSHFQVISLALHSQVPSTSHKKDSTPRSTRMVAACGGQCGGIKDCPSDCSACEGPSGCMAQQTCTCVKD